MDENNNLKNNGTKEKDNFLKRISTYIIIFIQCLRETLIARIFALSYPISLYFLKDKDNLYSFYITKAILLLSIIYFICYYIARLGRLQIINAPLFAYIGKQFLYCFIGYLAQMNLIFFDIYEIKEGNPEINIHLCALKILMIIEMAKRTYYYAIGIFILFEMEFGPRGDRCMYVMTFEIVYDYLWCNYYTNSHSTGFSYGIINNLIGLFFSLLNGIFAFGSHYSKMKIGLGIMNLVYLFAQLYSIHWRNREHY
jgi:hypothetical protein